MSCSRPVAPPCGAGQTVTVDLRETWQARADAWIRWSRSPELDDDFWRFHLPQFLDLLLPPGRLTVDMGCGEGRLGRVLAGAGHRVVGCDAAFAMVKAAADASQACAAVVADAVMLPLRDRKADLVIAFMCLHDFDDMRAAVGEAARVLAPGGRLAVALLHPVMTARLADTYAAECRYSVDTVEKAGLAMTYEGLHRPLTAYTAALAASGLVIEAIREPVKTDGDSMTMPFLDLLARRPSAF
jgi:SAM-dependent methyltransferase